MAANPTDLLDRVSDSTTGRPVIGSLASPGKAIAAATVSLADATNWTTTTAIHFSIFSTITVAGITVKDPSTQTDWKGTLAGLVISNLTLTGGTDRAYTAGAIVEITPTARWAKDLYDNISAHANQDGSLKTTAVQAALNIGTSNPDWTPLATPPSTVIYLGNRSYQVTFPGVDYTDRLNPGTRLRTTRTVAAPTQSTSLNGTNQYWNNTSPTKLTFTNNFVVDVWVKLTSYVNTIVGSRITTATGGFYLQINGSGQPTLTGQNGNGANFSQVASYQSIPLNKWTRITAQLDMASFTATPTTSYVMIDGIDVPATVARGGTNPTSLVQAGNLEIGSYNGGTLNFPGKISQFAIFGAKVPQATMQTYGNQSYLGTEPNLLVAYSFNGNGNDLNTSTPHNLTAQNSAAATNADSPFGNQANGTISSTLDYGIAMSVTKPAADTIVVTQVPEGCTIPTIGGVSAVSFSSAGKPFGMPTLKYKWRVQSLSNVQQSLTAAVNTWYNVGSTLLNIPAGSWNIGYRVSLDSEGSTTFNTAAKVTLASLNNNETNKQLTTGQQAASVTKLITTLSAEDGETYTVPSIRYLIAVAQSRNGDTLLYNGVDSPTMIYADPALL